MFPDLRTRTRLARGKFSDNSISLPLYVWSSIENLGFWDCGFEQRHFQLFPRTHSRCLPQECMEALIVFILFLWLWHCFCASIHFGVSIFCEWKGIRCNRCVVLGAIYRVMAMERDTTWGLIALVLASDMHTTGEAKLSNCARVEFWSIRLEL